MILMIILQCSFALSRTRPRPLPKKKPKGEMAQKKYMHIISQILVTSTRLKLFFISEF